MCFSFLGGGVQACLSATKLIFETSRIDKFVRDRPDVAPAKFGTRLPVTSAPINIPWYLFWTNVSKVPQTLHLIYI